jgi:hypothetical protein
MRSIGCRHTYLYQDSGRLGRLRCAAGKGLGHFGGATGRAVYHPYRIALRCALIHVRGAPPRGACARAVLLLVCCIALLEPTHQGSDIR